MKQQHVFALFSAVILSVVGSACGNSDSLVNVKDGEGALVITSDYQSGAYAVIDPDSLVAVTNIDVIHQDAVCRVDPHSGIPYVIGRLGGDLVDVLDPRDNWRIHTEYSVGAGTNPQDIAVISPDKAYVALYEADHLLIVNPATGEQTGTLELSEYADDDGIPEVSSLYYLEGMVYALIQRLSRVNGFLPTAYSQLLIIDGHTDQVVEAVTLADTNPTGKLRYNDSIGGFVIVESGVFSTMTADDSVDGGIEIFYPADRTLSGPIVSAQTLGGDIVDAVMASPLVGYAIVGMREGTRARTHLVSFDPTTGKQSKTIAVADSWDFRFIELSPDRSRLWLAQATRSAPGIRIFDTSDNTEVTEDPIDVGLPPSMICFVPNGDAIVPHQNGSAPDASDTFGPQDDSAQTNVVAQRAAVADIVIDAPCAEPDSPFGDPWMAVNGVRGGGDSVASTDVFSLRYCALPEDQYIVLGWRDGPVLNGPGTDIVVFENSIVQGTGPAVFMEHLVVYVSRDGATWVPFPVDYRHVPATEYSASPEMWSGFAGVHPVRYHCDDNPVNPFDFDAAGGDHFDLDDLPNTPEARDIKQHGIRYIKLVQASSLINPDTGDLFLQDPSSFDGAADIDGVVARYLSPQ